MNEVLWCMVLMTAVAVVGTVVGLLFLDRRQLRQWEESQRRLMKEWRNGDRESWMDDLDEPPF